MLFPRLRTEKMARLKRAAKMLQIPPNPPFLKGGMGGFSGAKKFPSYKHVCINEALSA